MQKKIRFYTSEQLFKMEAISEKENMSRLAKFSRGKFFFLSFKTSRWNLATHIHNVFVYPCVFLC